MIAREELSAGVFRKICLWNFGWSNKLEKGKGKKENKESEGEREREREWENGGTFQTYFRRRLTQKIAD